MYMCIYIYICICIHYTHGTSCSHVLVSCVCLLLLCHADIVCLFVVYCFKAFWCFICSPACISYSMTSQTISCSPVCMHCDMT